jgi:dipeptidyl aminopeptidase/acylaminoacyl peptidase
MRCRTGRRRCTGRYLLYSGIDPDAAVGAVIAYDLAVGTHFRFPGRPGGMGFAIAISPDGKCVLSGAIGSNTDCQCYLNGLDRPGTQAEAITAHLPGEYYYPGPWAGDAAGFYLLTTDADGDHVSLARYDLASRTLATVDSPAWNVEDVVVSGDCRTVVWSVNEDGYSVLHAIRDGAPLQVPEIPGGVLKAMSIGFYGTALALLLSTPGQPPEITIARLGTTEPTRYLTDTRPEALQTGAPVIPEPIRYPAPGGTSIPALLYLPPGPGPHPVLLSVHGGPEVQARPAYDPLHQCLLANGIAVLAPNIHGSTGYGHTWQTRIYRDWGGIDLYDLAAAHAWLATQDWADRDKIAVFGISYGGFAALSCVTRLPSLWAAGISVCGPSNLDSLARSMPADWAATITAMFGNPDDPADAAELRRRSPLTYASQISAPLLVMQGAHDPRVPQAESEQIVSAARANGADVRYELFTDEGHGFTSRGNSIKAYTIITEFLSERLRSSW